MCFMCTQFEQERMTKQEVWTYIGEVINTDEIHTSEFVKNVIETEKILQEILDENEWIYDVDD